MKILQTDQVDFAAHFDEILARGGQDIKNVTKIVGGIIDEVKTKGDAALLDHIAKFDRWTPKKGSDLAVSQKAMKKAYDGLEADLKAALHTAYDRVKAFHVQQLPKSWQTYEANGTILGQKASPVDRAGLYIPGGKAAYPSSLIMNAVPAIVAGVEEIVVCVPTPDDELNDLVLAAAHICGIEKMFKVGGASAVAAMAYGTETIPGVDVITGPGNIFVATAKKMVFGDVNIDMIAGPSEIGILADHTAKPSYLAIDLLSQAEHDQMASSIMITPSKELAVKTVGEIYQYLSRLERSDIAKESIESRGAVIVTKDMDEAVELMNRIAPEHLEVMTANPFALLPAIKHAGAIFLGENTPEAIGDYVAGPNHTLPTGGTARFFSPLGVENFMKKSSVIAFSKKGVAELGEACKLLSETEGLTAHMHSVLERLEQK